MVTRPSRRLGPPVALGLRRVTKLPFWRECILLVVATLLSPAVSATPARPFNSSCQSTVALVVGGADFDSIPDGNGTLSAAVATVDLARVDPDVLAGDVEWARRTALPAPRAEAAVGSIQLADDEAFVFVAGGRSSGPDGNTAATSHLMYSVGRDGWSALEELPEGRVGGAMAAVEVGGEYFLFIVGGYNPAEPGCTNLSTLIYNFNDQRYEVTEALQTNRHGLAVAAVRPGNDPTGWEIFAAGGVDCNGDVVDVVEKFVLDDGMWEPVASLTPPRAWLGLAAVAVNGRWWLYAMGGSTGVEPQNATTVVEQYDVGAPANGWVEMDPLPKARFGFATIPMESGDGKWAVRVVGGQEPHATLANSTFALEVDSGRWNSTDDMLHPREYLGAATVCTSARTNEAGSGDEDVTDLEIILGVVGGCVLVVLIVGTFKVMQATSPRSRHPNFRDVQYQTFPNVASAPAPSDDAGHATDV